MYFSLATNYKTVYVLLRIQWALTLRRSSGHSKAYLRSAAQAMIDGFIV